MKGIPSFEHPFQTHVIHEIILSVCGLSLLSLGFMRNLRGFSVEPTIIREWNSFMLIQDGLSILEFWSVDPLALRFLEKFWLKLNNLEIATEWGRVWIYSTLLVFIFFSCKSTSDLRKLLPYLLLLGRALSLFIYFLVRSLSVNNHAMSLNFFFFFGNNVVELYKAFNYFKFCTFFCLVE